MEQGNGLDGGCLEGAVGSTKCPSKTSERALKECVCMCVCVQDCVVFDPVHVKTHIPKIRKGVFYLCGNVQVCVFACLHA